MTACWLQKGRGCHIERSPGLGWAGCYCHTVSAVRIATAGSSPYSQPRRKQNIYVHAIPISNSLTSSAIIINNKHRILYVIPAVECSMKCINGKVNMYTNIFHFCHLILFPKYLANVVFIR